MIYPLFSDKAPASSRFTPKDTSTLTENKFNARVIVDSGDLFWDGVLAYKNLNYDQAVTMRSFLNRLKGPEHDFWFKDYAHKQRSAWTGSPVVDGDNQDGTLLNVRGLLPNQTLLEGDRFQLGDYLHELTETITVDGLGLASLKFVPDIRFIPSDGDALITNDPMCKCMLYPGQTVPEPSAGKAVLTDFSFKFRESLRD